MSVQCVCGSWDHEPWQHPDRTPTTDAGRRLLEDVADMNAERGTEESTVVYRDAILAIEDEARAPLVAALDVDMVRGLNDAARTLIEQLDRHGLGNLALFEQQVEHLRGHLLSDAALSREDRP